MDLLFCSSDPALDPDSRLYIGWSMIGILALSIIVNQGTLVVGSISSMIKNCKKNCIRRQHKKAMALNKSKQERNKKKKNLAKSETQVDRD